VKVGDAQVVDERFDVAVLGGNILRALRGIWI